MSIEELLQTCREDILHLAARRGARNVRVFGSAARHEAGSDSDIDLLVDVAPEPTPLLPRRTTGRIGECITRIEPYTAEGREAFFADTRTQDAVVRNLQVLAESTPVK